MLSPCCAKFSDRGRHIDYCIPKRYSEDDLRYVYEEVTVTGFTTRQKLLQIDPRSWNANRMTRVIPLTTNTLMTDGETLPKGSTKSVICDCPCCGGHFTVFTDTIRQTGLIIARLGCTDPLERTPCENYGKDEEICDHCEAGESNWQNNERLHVFQKYLRFLKSLLEQGESLLLWPNTTDGHVITTYLMLTTNVHFSIDPDGFVVFSKATRPASRRKRMFYFTIMHDKIRKLVTAITILCYSTNWTSRIYEFLMRRVFNHRLSKLHSQNIKIKRKRK